MSDRSPRADDERLSEEAAHRVLTRAVELDVRDMGSIETRRLREIAAEAGVSTAAFERALAESRGVVSSDPPSTPTGHDASSSFARVIWRRLRGAQGRRGGGAHPTSLGDRVVVEACAFAAFFAVAWMTAGVRAALSLTWATAPALELPTYAFGLFVAARLRARATLLLLATVAGSRLAEVPMQLLFGVDAVGGMPTKLALAIAVVFGMAVGVWLLGGRRGVGGAGPGDAFAGADEVVTSVRRPEAGVGEAVPRETSTNAVRGLPLGRTRSAPLVPEWAERARCCVGPA